MERATDWRKTFKVEWDMTNDVGLGVVLEEGRGGGGVDLSTFAL